VERELVLRLASILWRLRRATGIETALFERVLNDADKAKSENQPGSSSSSAASGGRGKSYSPGGIAAAQVIAIPLQIPVLIPSS
jgi:hypothetical protein